MEPCGFACYALSTMERFGHAVFLRVRLGRKRFNALKK
jgi:hypothetical protein